MIRRPAVIDRIVHKTSEHKGPMCASMKLGEDTTGSWAKTNCAKCLAWRDEHKYDRQKRYQARKKKTETEDI